MKGDTDLDAIVLSRADEYRLVWYPLNGCDSTIMRAPYDVQEPSIIVEVPESDMSTGRGAG